MTNEVENKPKRGFFRRKIWPWLKWVLAVMALNVILRVIFVAVQVFSEG